jgi:hypothetical protein
MNRGGFLDLANNSNFINSEQTLELNEIIEAYPYFQTARTLQLKGLKNSNSFKYNSELKKTAAYTIDRNVLFNFITKNISIPKVVKEEVKEKNIIEEVNESLISKSEFEDSLEINFIKKDSSEESVNEVLEIGKPIEFKSSEPHSFNEWMQLIQQKPIERETSTIKKTKKQSGLETKIGIIDKFITTNPKIKPVDKSTQNFHISDESLNPNESLMTETLAKVYLEQKKYDSAIKAYRILSLKYPEKSSFFATRIKGIKILQKNKS